MRNTIIIPDIYRERHRLGLIFCRPIPTIPLKSIECACTEEKFNVIHRLEMSDVTYFVVHNYLDEEVEETDTSESEG